MFSSTTTGGHKTNSKVVYFYLVREMSSVSVISAKNHFKNHQTYSEEHNLDIFIFSINLSTKYINRDTGHKAEHSIVTYY